MIQPRIQQPADLKLIVTDHPSFEPQFTVLETANVAIADWLFTFQIIGESHTLMIKRDGIVQLQETLVCADLLPEYYLHYHTFASQTDHVYQTERYSIEVCFTSVPSAGQFMIDYRFPEVEGQMPVTGIGWQQDRGKMVWWTLHTYPHERGCAYVETRSYFDYANRG